MNLSRVHRPLNIEVAKEWLQQVVNNSPQKSESLKEALKLLRKIDKESGVVSMKKPPAPKISIRALWANNAATSTIKISPRQWKKIQEGKEFKKGGWGYYERQRFSVSWYFNNRNVTIYADEQECIHRDPIEKLYLDSCHETPPYNSPPSFTLGTCMGPTKTA
jgi:hypothetical protein